MSAARDEVQAILDRMAKNCEARARLLKSMGDRLDRLYPELSEPWQTVPPPLSPRIDTGD